MPALGSSSSSQRCSTPVPRSRPDPTEAADQRLRQIGSPVPGLVLATATRSEVSLWSTLGVGAPVVLINRAVPELPFDSVTSDNAGGAEAVAEHFLREGHRRIACITGTTEISTISEREEGFFRALATAGNPVQEDMLLRADVGHGAGHIAMRNLLQRAVRPTAVFCTNDLLAMGALDGARFLGVPVPGEVSIAGFDDVPQASWDGYQLTTVHQALEQMVHDAVDILLERIAEPQREPRNRRLATRLIRRRSTGSAS